MTNQDKASPMRQAAEDFERGVPGSPGFAAVAKRIRVWTTNCLVSILILVAGLAFGRQVLRWWSEGDAARPAVPRPLASDPFAHPSAHHDFEFGNHSWAMSRRWITDDPKRALAELRTDAAARTQRAALPDDPVAPAERALLDRIAGEKPVLEEKGAWQLHEFAGPCPMVVGTRVAATDSEASGGRKLAGPPQRVVTWGLGIPSAEDGWTLYTFHCTGAQGQTFPGLPELPLPPGAVRTLAMRATGGGAAIGFRGSREAETWKQFFDQWFRRHGWSAAKWRRSGMAWHLRGRNVRTGQESVTVDVQFGPKPDGQLEGILVITPASPLIEENAQP